MLAQNNLYGVTGAQNIEALLYDDTDNAANSAVVFSQATLEKLQDSLKASAPAKKAEVA